MEIKDPNVHQKLIEMCDCYMETDHIQQLKRLANSESKDIDEDAVKYLALALLHAVSEKARKLTFKKKKGKYTILYENDGKNSLPIPAHDIIEKIFANCRSIMHLEEDKGKMPLSLGLKNDSIEVQMKIELKGDDEALKFKMPAL